MDSFPTHISPQYKNDFRKFVYDYYLATLRKHIYVHILTEDENSYVDLDTWCRKNIKNDTTLMTALVSQIKDELVSLGWKCKFSFNNTGLFIYSSTEPPPSCYDDEF